MTPEQVAAILAARTPGRWNLETKATRWLAISERGLLVYADGRDSPNRRAIVTAVNLAEPLLVVAEAAREHTDSECRCGGFTHSDTCALIVTEEQLRAALAALDTAMTAE